MPFVLNESITKTTIKTEQNYEFLKDNVKYMWCGETVQDPRQLGGMVIILRNIHPDICKFNLSMS
jgi:hypothetical protein